MLWSGKQVKETIEEAKALVEMTAIAPLRENLKDAAFAYESPDDVQFMLWWQQVATPAFILMLALDDGPNGKDWLRRYEQITGNNPLEPWMQALVEAAKE